MKTIDAINHYKTKAAIARELGISLSAVSHWAEIVPVRQAIRLARKVGKELPVGYKDY